MAKKTGLGKGLDALFAEADEATTAEKPKSTLKVSEITPRSGQPRKYFDKDALSALADSIAANGLISPIAVRKSPNGYYEIIAGERRWRAARLAGLSEVPVIILDTDDRQTAELSLIENLQREDLNPIEEALAYKSLMGEFGMTQEQVADKVGKSRAAVANTLRLLDLPEDVKKMLESGEISEGMGRAALGLRDKSKIAETLTTAVEKGLSVRQIEELVRKINEAKPKTDTEDEEKPRSVKDVDYVAELERRIRNSIGHRVKITEGRKVKKIEIEYTDNSDLENILKTLCGDDFFNE